MASKNGLLTFAEYFDIFPHNKAFSLNIPPELCCSRFSALRKLVLVTMSSNQHSIIFEYLLIHLNKLVTPILASKPNELSSTIHAIRDYIDFGPARSFSNGLESWGILSLALGLPLLATYIVSMYRFGTATRSMKFGKVVPAIPYLIPAIGHAFSFAWDTTETLSQAMYVFQTNLLSNYDFNKVLTSVTESSLEVSSLCVSSSASRTLMFSRGQITSSCSGSCPRN